jgi:hypothetical protein
MVLAFNLWILQEAQSQPTMGRLLPYLAVKHPSVVSGFKGCMQKESDVLTHR